MDEVSFWSTGVIGRPAFEASLLLDCDEKSGLYTTTLGKLPDSVANELSCVGKKVNCLYRFGTWSICSGLHWDEASIP